MEKQILKHTNNFEKRAHPQHQQGQQQYLQYTMIPMMINHPRAINHYLVLHISTIEKRILRLVVVDLQSTNIGYDIMNETLVLILSKFSGGK